MLAVAVAFALGMALQYVVMLRPAAIDTDFFPHELVWTDDLAGLETTWTRFSGRLMAESPYRGTPNESIDAAWARYTESKWVDGGAVVLGVSDDDVARSRKDGRTDDAAWFNSTVVLDDTNGGGYMATLEVFHQLHCLV